MTLAMQPDIAFGPVPSRRLGRSLGINNIPPKACSYSCIYCQVGRTLRQEIEPRSFYSPQTILRTVQTQVEAARRRQAAIDYLTFVPDGEPTLDAHLGDTMDLLRPLGIRIAVISNSSLIWREEVQAVLHKADWVSLKVDSVQEAHWRRINRPQAQLSLPQILCGIEHFARHYQGQLCTETMLVAGINDHSDTVSAVAQFLAQVKPHTAYLAIPTRPPAESEVRAPSEAVINRAYQQLEAELPAVEYLIGYEGNAFAFSGDVERDLLSISAVHPLREEAVKALLARAEAGWSVVQQLLAEGKLKQVEFAGHCFYVRAFHSSSEPVDLKM